MNHLKLTTYFPAVFVPPSISKVHRCHSLPLCTGGTCHFPVSSSVPESIWKSLQSFSQSLQSFSQSLQSFSQPWTLFPL